MMSVECYISSSYYLSFLTPCSPSSPSCAFPYQGVELGHLPSYSVDRACIWALQIAEGLEALQEADIFYSKLSLVNVLLVHLDGNVKLSGFDVLMDRDNLSITQGGRRLASAEEEREEMKENFDTRDQNFHLGMVLFQILGAMVVGDTTESDSTTSSDYFQVLARQGTVVQTLRETTTARTDFRLPSTILEVLEGLLRVEPSRRMPINYAIDRLQEDTTFLGRPASRSYQQPLMIQQADSLQESIRGLEKKIWEMQAKPTENKDGSHVQEEEEKGEASHGNEDDLAMIKVRQELAEVYERQGKGYRALELHHDIVRDIQSLEHQRPATLMVVESWEAMGRIYQRRGGWHSALAVREAVYAYYQKEEISIIPEESADLVAKLASSLDALALTKLSLGGGQREEEAMAHFTSALSLLRARHPEEQGIQQILPSVLSHVSAVHRARKQYDMALTFLEEALDVRRFGSAVGVAGCLMGLAGVYQDRKEVDVAMSFLVQAQTCLKKEAAAGENPTDAARDLTLADVLERMAYLHLAYKKDKAKSVACHQEAIQLRRKSLSPYHPDLARSIHSLANVFERTRDYEQAVQAYQEAVDLRQMSLPDAHADTAASLHGLGNAYQFLGLYSEALNAYQQSLDIRRKIQMVEAATTLNNMAGVYQSQRAYPPAMRCLQDALKVYQTLKDDQGVYKEAMANTLLNIDTMANLLESHGYGPEDWMTEEELARLGYARTKVSRGLRQDSNRRHRSGRSRSRSNDSCALM